MCLVLKFPKLTIAFLFSNNCAGTYHSQLILSPEEKLARQIDRQIPPIEAGIIGIDDVFDDEPMGYGWTVNNFNYASFAQIGGLMYNENMVRVIIEANSLGEYM